MILYVYNIFKKTVDLFFNEPLKRLYFDAPSFGSFGGWNGNDSSLICTELTNIPPSHWDNEGFEHCNILLNKRFDTFYSIITNCFRIYIFVSALSEIYILSKLFFLFSIQRTSHSISRKFSFVHAVE